MAKNDDLTALFKAFMESRTDTAEDKDELKLRIKDLDRTLKEITQFFKTQGLYSKELGVVLKQAIEVEKQEVKRKKGSGQGLPRIVSDMHLDSIIKRAIEGSLKGTAGIFDTKNQNKLLQDSIKTIKDNQNAYEKLSNSLTGLQKSVADLGGKLATLMGTSGGSKDSAGGGSGLGALAAALAGKGKNGKDPDLKSAVPKGNGFMKGISTLIGFLGNKSGSGFLGKLGSVLAEYAKGVGWDILKLAAYSLISLARKFGPSVLKPIKWLAMGGSILSGVLKGGASRGLMSAFRALKQGGTAAKVAKATKLGVKAGAKWGAKTAAKKIPGLSLAAGIGFGAARWAEGDKLGAVMEIVSGIAACFPGIGTAISAIIDIGLGVKDFFNWKKKRDNTVGKSVDSLSKDIDDRGKEQKGFWENFCNWIKDHWGLLAGAAVGGPIGAGIGAVVDHFRNKGSDGSGGSPDGNKGLNSENNVVGSRTAKSFKERKKAAENYYYNNLTYEHLGMSKEERAQMKAHNANLPQEIRKKFGVIMGGGLTPWLGATDAWDIYTGATMKGVLANADPSAYNTTMGASAVSSTSIGAGQTYSASAAGGSKLGDAFFGGNLATISAGGGFRRPEEGRDHKGIDLPYKYGTSVKAFLPGTFEYYSDNLGGFGKVIGIRDDNGMMNIYAHLSHINKSLKGKRIERGQEIGRSGRSGYNAITHKPVAEHLHFEVRPSMAKGGSVNPVAHVASALGYSVDSLPDSGPIFADSSTSSGSSRAASEPKGIYNEGEGDIVASAGESGESIEQTLKNAYANNQFDQTGNVQFLSAINSIRVQLGKYQQIGYVN